MKLGRALAFALLAACVPIAAFAQTAYIFNNGGAFSSNDADNVLEMNGTHQSSVSSLFGVTGLGMGDCGGAAFACSGTVSLTTGAITTGGTSMSLVPLSNQVTDLASGGSFNVAESANMAHGIEGFTFSGTFTKETWACASGSSCGPTVNSHGRTVPNSWTGSWTLTGTIMNGTLTIGGQTFTIAQAVTVQLTTTNSVATYNTAGNLVFTGLASGTTNFPSPVPEPGTLGLLGGGLIGLGIFARRRLGSPSLAADVE